MALVNKDAAVMVRDAEAEELLVETLKKLLNDTAYCEKLQKNIVTLAMVDSDEKIAQEILQIISK